MNPAYVTVKSDENGGNTSQSAPAYQPLKVSTIGLLEAPNSISTTGQVTLNPTIYLMDSFNEIERLLEQGIRKGGRLSLEAIPVKISK